MNLLPPEQLASAQKASVGTMFVLTRKTFEGCQRLCQLVETEAERRQEKASFRTRRTDFG